jgi:hypothetical protein
MIDHISYSEDLIVNAFKAAEAIADEPDGSVSVSA